MLEMVWVCLRSFCMVMPRSGACGTCLRVVSWIVVRERERERERERDRETER